MCTAITYLTNNHYFGRNLDFEHSFGEEIVITPRNYPFSFRKLKSVTHHYAIIGMGIVSDNFPLYFDATNEVGLSMAGLLFSGYAHYHEIKHSYDNAASFELIVWVLSQCKSILQAKELLEKANVADIDFSTEYPSTPLHWIISDKTGSITVESVKEGLLIYDNPAGVLTNNPPFPLQMFNLNNYMSLSPQPPENTFSEKLELSVYSRGMGALGLPGDLSSASRFVRAAFTRLNSFSEENEQSSVSQFFHILSSVYQTRGSVRTEENLPEITLYSSCTNTDKGIYYYTTYDNTGINAVNMHSQNLDSDKLCTFPLIREWKVNFQS